MMPDSLLDAAALERSSVVANSTMNRERGIRGRNSYALDLGLDVIGFLIECCRRSAPCVESPPVAWLDLCCGTGRALVEAGRALSDRGLEAQVLIQGVDLVPMFDPSPHRPGCVRLEAASLSAWNPERAYDLVTCVHGLHYIGDKLDLIGRAVSWLAPDGLFLAHLDEANLALAGDPDGGRAILRELRRQGLRYEGRRWLLSRSGRAAVRFPFRYLGADDRSGPNYTGQPAVTSYYALEGSS
jgi:SAM-dependent methyltransferase